MTHSPGFLQLVNDAKSRVRETDVDGYKGMIARGDDHVLVDVREDSEWNAGHMKKMDSLCIMKVLVQRTIVRNMI